MKKLLTLTLLTLLLCKSISWANPIPSKLELCARETFSVTVPQLFVAPGDSLNIYIKGIFGGKSQHFLIGKSSGTSVVSSYINEFIPNYANFQLYAKNKIRGDSIISTSVLRVTNVPLSSIDFAQVQYLGSLDNKVYLKSVSAITYPQAKITAKQFGVELALINDSTTNNFLKQFADSSGTWFNYSDELVENAWRDLRNRKSAFVNWENREPNNFVNEDYGTVKPTGKWNDRFRDLPLQTFFEVDVKMLPQIFSVYGGNLHLEAPPIAGAAYEWFGPNGYFSTTPQSLVQNFTPSNQGNYFLIMQKGGCTSQDLLINYKIDTKILDTSLYKFGQSYNGFDYYVSKYKVSFQQATAFAQSIGGNLADIYDSTENNIVSNTLPDADKWIGLTDEETEGTYRWITTNQTSTYYNWAVGEPNNHLQAENYIQMRRNGKWNDIFANLNTAFALKIKKHIVVTDLTTEILCIGSQFVIRPIASGPQTDQNPITVEAQNTATQIIYRLDVQPTILADSLTITTTTLPVGNYRLRVTASIPVMNGLWSEQTIRISNGSHISPLLSIINDSVFSVADPSVRYQWYRNDSIISGANAEYILANLPGLYILEATKNACVGRSNPIQYGPVSTRDIQIASITISPNPTFGQFIVKSSMGLHSVRIRTIDGRLLSVADVVGKENLEFTLPKPGVYLVEVVDKNNYRQSHRVIRL